MGLRRLARQLRAGRRKAALAVGYAAYVEGERAAGRVPMSKRAWRVGSAKGEKGHEGAKGWGDKSLLSSDD